MTAGYFGEEFRGLVRSKKHIHCGELIVKLKREKDSVIFSFLLSWLCDFCGKHPFNRSMNGAQWRMEEGSLASVTRALGGVTSLS